MLTGRRRSGSGALALELVVVCLGVVIALAADSWWKSREDASRVRATLEAVSADLGLAREELEAAHQRDLDIIVTMREARAWLRTGRPIPDSVRMPGTPGPSIGTIPIGSLRALLESGDVNLLESRSLRATLVSSFAALEESVAARDFYFHETFEAYSELVAIRDAERAHLGPPSTRIPLALAASNSRLIEAQAKYWAALRELIYQLRGIARSVATMHAAIAADIGFDRAGRPKPSGVSGRLAVDLPRAALEPLVGTYRLREVDGDVVARIRLVEDGLVAEWEDGRTLALAPESTTLFFVQDDDIQFEFVGTQRASHPSMLMYFDGLSRRFDWIADVN
jgi:hypothetical protein